MTQDAPISPAFIPARLVAKRYAVTIRCIDRWEADDRLNFPRPVYIGRVADLERWEAEQAKRGEEAAA
jgi:hypothetical protein